MGGTQSKSVINQVTEISVKATMRTIQECSTAATQSQLIDLQAKGDITIGDVTQRQGVQVDSKCLAQSDKQVKIRNDVAAAIANYAEAQGPAVLSLLGASKSEATVNIQNRLPMSFNMDTIQKNVTAVMQNQKIAVKSTEGKIIAGALTQEQTAQIVAKSIVADKSYASALNDISNKIAQGSKAKSTNPIADIISSIGTAFTGWIVYIAIAIIVIVAAILGLRVMRAGKSQSGGELDFDL